MPRQALENTGFSGRNRPAHDRGGVAAAFFLLSPLSNALDLSAPFCPITEASVDLSLNIDIMRGMVRPREYEDRVEEVLALAGMGWSLREIAAELGMGKSTVHRILKRREENDK